MLFAVLSAPNRRLVRGPSILPTVPSGMSSDQVGFSQGTNRTGGITAAEHNLLTHLLGPDWATAPLRH
ncbi:hypothetical protein CORC01_06821 [Colletotrichum orchidophilum]|uniref:Uncharacterized protein n=1 Tax=Colletotrichum orchidophilum TaxID=1209926 RepID=A0A1G4B958_9PEZI|nr:uncharacterized protein CORC01_06821 [Colletotrichum orchidophilum]OHE97958.1 hypothetical protein CORC01_06821 [Colletotrichum orchidophilum]